MSLTYEPTDLELGQCTLYNYAGESMDIRNILREWNIYSSIFSNAVIFKGVLVDGNGLVEIFPIIGEETMEIEFRTPSYDNFTTYLFRIYNVEGKDKFEPRSEKYIIKGLSQESVNNMQRKVRKSFVDVPVSNVVEEIYNAHLRPGHQDFVKVKKNKKKPLTVHNTAGNISVAFTGEHPFAAIKYLAQEAQAATDDRFTQTQDPKSGSAFYFFEKTDGYHFETVDSMLLKPAVKDFYFTQASYEDDITDGDKIPASEKITTYNFVEQTDIMENMGSGHYLNLVEAIDPITKQFTKDVFSYQEESNNITHLEHEKKKLDATFLQSEGSSVFGGETTKTHYIVSDISPTGEKRSQIDYLSPAVATDPQIRNARQLHKFLKYNVVAKAQLGNVVLSITIPGNSRLEVGDVVNLHIPQASEIPDIARKLNFLYDKRFLVTAIRHTYNKADNKYYTIFECRKDTYGKKAEKVE